MGLAKLHCEKVYTSGEAALTQLNEKINNLNFIILDRLEILIYFKSFEKNKVENINDANFYYVLVYLMNI